jgi:formate dehydrogenase subunit delta
VEDKTAKLVRMANQIADFFSSFPEKEAVANTAQHLKNFWEPRMRAEITKYVENGGAGLHTHALEAVKHLAEAKRQAANQPTG